MGDITDSYSGGTPSVGVKEYYDGDIPFIRSAEINSDKTELFITQKGLENSSARIAEIGDILYALYGATSGEVGLARLKGAVNQAILVIKPHGKYCSEFIMQWLRKSKQNIVDIYLQGGQGNLSGTIVKALLIDCPTYEEQQKIGEYFRSLDNLITLHQRKQARHNNRKELTWNNYISWQQKERKINMLRIILGNDVEAIYNTSVYFKNTYTGEWITDELSIQMIKDVDKSDVIGPNLIQSPVLGAISPKELSGGVKTLILIYKDRSKIFNASNCGDNCAKWLLRMGETEDIIINLRHLMDFGTEDFEIEIMNTHQIVNSMEQFVDVAGEFV